MIEISAFSTAVYTSSLDVAGVDELAYELRAQDQTKVSFSNRGGWQSPDQSQASLPLMSNIVDQIIQSLMPVYDDHGIDRTPRLGNYWFNINPTHSYNLVHTHPGSMFSTVLYVQVPEHSGNLILQRSDNQQAYVIPNRSTPRNQTNFVIEPYAGMLVAFPSHVPHYVEQNHSDQDRITVAFNFV